MTRAPHRRLWLRADLAANSTENVVAVWHKPRFSSGVTNYTALQPLYEALYDFGVDILLVGHDHIYERLAAMNPAGAADPTFGIRQFTVGTGGAALQSFTPSLPTSEVGAGNAANAYGVLKLTLRPTTYDWKFLPIAGTAFTDSGTGSVHAAPPPQAFDDGYSTTLDTPLVVAAPGVLTNDTRSGGGSLTAALVTDVSNGSLTLNADGGFSYTPDCWLHWR